MSVGFDRALLLVQAASTAFLVGLVWFVQVVHYPLFADVSTSDFVAYEARHRLRTGVVVGPPMLLELATALAALWLRPARLPALWAWSGLLLLGVVWASTAFVQVPLHDRLSRGFDPGAAASLVRTNWVRTAAWTARGVLLAWGLGRLLVMERAITSG